MGTVTSYVAIARPKQRRTVITVHSITALTDALHRQDL